MHRGLLKRLERPDFESEQERQRFVHILCVYPCVENINA